MASDVGWPWVNGERGGGGRVFFVELSPGLIILPPPPHAKEPLHSHETMRTRVCTTELSLLPLFLPFNALCNVPRAAAGSVCCPTKERTAMPV